MKLLNDMALFVEVAKAMSFKNASENTGIPTSTLSRRINELEKSIRLRLLHRTTRQIQLTEAGKIYFERCKKIVEEAELAHQQLEEIITEPSGILKISMPVDFGLKFVAPIITEFSKKYPKISFEFDVNARKIDMISENYDILIRIGIMPDSNLVARHLMTLPTYLYASPTYLDNHGIPKKIDDLKHHECLNIFKATEWELYLNNNSIKIPIQSKFTVNNVGMLRELAIHHAGIILLPLHIVDEAVINHQLVQVLEAWQGKPFEVYAITATRLLPAKTRYFLDFLKTKFDEL